MITIVTAPEYFSDWPTLLRLLRTSFAYMDERIDPPSSMHRLDLRGLEAKARDETLILAFAKQELVGCAFTHPSGDALYIGKVAVAAHHRGQGIARQLFAAAEQLARAQNLPLLELQTRIELEENHRTFAAMGFVRTGESAHEGYDRPTSITMQKRLSAPTT